MSHEPPPGPPLEPTVKPLGQAGYGTPTYGAPSYGAPSYGAPSYGEAPTPAVAMPGEPVSLGARFAARVVDGLVNIAIIAICIAAAMPLEQSAPVASYLLGALGLLSYFGGYEYVCTAKWGQTIGKKVMRMRIVTVATGDVPGWGRAAGRSLLPTLAGFCSGGLGALLFWISILFDKSPWKRGWHDQIAGTVVISSQRAAR